jgi:hypothetical protein
MPSSWATILGLSWPARIAGILPKQERAYTDGLNTSDWIHTDRKELRTRRRTPTEGEQGGRLRRASLTHLPSSSLAAILCLGLQRLGLKAGATDDAGNSRTDDNALPAS